MGMGATATPPGPGPMPKPRWMPLPQLLYAQVVKTLRRRRIIAVKHRVVFGTKAAVEQVLAACGWQINTAFVERLNLSLRQRVAAMRRRSAMSCKGEDGLRQQLILSRSITISCCLTPVCVRLWLSPFQRMAMAQPRRGSLVRPQWRRLTDHVWSLRSTPEGRLPFISSSERRAMHTCPRAALRRQCCRAWRHRRGTRAARAARPADRPGPY